MRVALCCIAKCENLYLAEWTNHHIGIGFDHIYIYDNNDKDGERCEDVVGRDNRNVTVLKYFIGKSQKGCEVQLDAYNDFYRRFGKNFDWVLYSDVDEFLVLNGYTDVHQWLRNIAKPGTLSVQLNWKCYGDGGQLHYRPLPVKERFKVECSDKELNRYKKSFFKTRIGNFKMVNVHYSSLTGDVVDCDGKPVHPLPLAMSNESNLNTAYLAHYATKSADEYYAIKKKRRCAGIGNDRLNIEHYFKFNERTNEKALYLEKLLDGEIETGSFGECSEPSPEFTEKNGISICISAWNAQDYIEECLDSVASQTWFAENSNWEILLGIDACKKTVSKVKEIAGKYRNLRVFVMDENVGTYVTCNTIMAKARYSHLIRFDSDDIMLPGMVERVVREICTPGNPDVVKYRCKTFSKDGIIDPDRYAEGSICIKKDLFVKYGGYMPWRCSSDSELRKRLRPVLNFFYINEPLYMLRRDNENSLTVGKKTSMDSGYRKEREEYINTRSEKIPVIELLTTKCRELEPNKVVVSFTTWRKRDAFVPTMLDNFMHQTKFPDKIICWLSEDEYGAGNVPETIQPYADSKTIEIRWVKENIYCHKRYEVFRENDNCVNIIIDDDILYDNDYVEKLYNASLEHPNSVICYISNKIKYTDTGREFLPVRENPSVLNYYLSGMSCFPPFTFPKETFLHTETRDRLATKCDDSWVSAWLFKEKTPIYAVHGRDKKWVDIKDAQYCSLWNENKVMVDGVLKKTKTFFDVCKSIGVYGEIAEIYRLGERQKQITEDEHNM